MKKKRVSKFSNKGYSFVELIIVLAIMALMSAMAIVTWNSVESAKYRNGVATFESELDTLRTATMAYGNGMALKIYYEPNYQNKYGRSIGAYVIKRGVYDGSTFYEVTYKTPGALPAEYQYLANSTYYSYAGVSDPVFVVQKGAIQYAMGSDDYEIIGDSSGIDGVIIQYNKSDGSIMQDSDTGEYRGAGDFVFLKRNGDVVACVRLVPVTGTYHELY